jgi:hypothetical protein
VNNGTATGIQAPRHFTKELPNPASFGSLKIFIRRVKKDNVGGKFGLCAPQKTVGIYAEDLHPASITQ